MHFKLESIVEHLKIIVCPVQGIPLQRLAPRFQDEVGADVAHDVPNMLAFGGAGAENFMHLPVP